MLNILLPILVIFLLLFCLFDYLIRNGRTYKLATSLKGPKMLPYIGSVEFLGLDQGNWSNSRLKLKKSLNCYFPLCIEHSFTLARKNALLYRNGYRYWTFGIFIYNIYSADLLQVCIILLIQNAASFHAWFRKLKFIKKNVVFENSSPNGILFPV